MSFKSNPLSLSIPEPAFESWLRDTGYLELLDQRSSAPASSSSVASAGGNPAVGPGVIADGIFTSLFSYLGILLSLFTLNPFAKLTNGDFSRERPSWSHGFVGSCDSYSFPLSSTQARLRVQENVKRFAGNYATLFVLFFACSLYQMPFALVGLISSLALWDFFKFSSDRWGLDQRPILRQCLIRISQCAAAVVLICCNVQMALFSALAVSYAVLILHAAFRKLTPSKHPHKRKK